MFALADLEELVGQCRDVKTRALLREATDCYRSRAYRSCIVGTWIALVYDLIEKFRELALTGDGKAIALVEKIDAIHEKRDTDQALAFERNVLEIARDEYELISEQEFADLERLRLDRNRFAHPNLNQDAQALSASPELARLHIRSAIDHVLSRPPVQGKAAVDAVFSLVESEYFPENVEEALVALESGPLKRAKRALVKQFVFGAITSVLREDLVPKVVRQRIAAARACYRMHDSLVESLFSDNFATTAASTSDKKIPYLLYLIALFPEARRFVGASSKIRLEKYVEAMPDHDVIVAVYAGEVDFLHEFARTRLGQANASQLKDITERLHREPTRLLVDTIVRAYTAAKNWDSANLLAATLQSRLIPHLSEDDAVSIVKAAGSNAEVRDSFGYAPLVKRMIEDGKISRDAVLGIAREDELPPALVARMVEVDDVVRGD